MLTTTVFTVQMLDNPAFILLLPFFLPYSIMQLGSEFDVEDTLGPKRPFYKRRLFWSLFFVSIWVISFVAAGVSLLVFKENVTTSGFQAWRLCFFLAGLPVIWYIGEFVTLSIVFAVEKSMFTVKNALYFAYAVRVSRIFMNKGFFYEHSLIK